MASWITDDKPSSGGGGGTTDHRDLTHRNDADQHSGDAIKVTTTFPGDSEPSDKTLTEGIAAVIAATGDGLSNPRTTATYTTGSLALNESDDAGSITLAKTFTALRIQTTRAARVRLYATAAQRTADLARAISSDPTGDHGLLLEFVTGTDLDWAITPPAIGMSLETSPGSSIPIAITNLDTTGTVGVTLTYLGAES